MQRAVSYTHLKYKTAEDIRRYTGLATLAVVPVEGPERGARRTAHDRRKA